MSQRSANGACEEASRLPFCLASHTAADTQTYPVSAGNRKLGVDGNVHNVRDAQNAEPNADTRTVLLPPSSYSQWHLASRIPQTTIQKALGRRNNLDNLS